MARFPKILALTLALSLAAAAAWGFGEDLFTWAVRTNPAQIAPGRSGAIEATLTIEKDHIVYGDMTSLEAGGFAVGTLGEVAPPKGEMKDDPFGTGPREIFTGTVTYRIPVTVNADAVPGTYTVELRTAHQGCSTTVCFFPEKLTHTVDVVVAAGGVGVGAPVGAGGVAGGGGGFAATLERGWILAFLAVFVGGVLTSLTPCVYPLIPITVSVFGATAARSRTRAFGLSAVYVLGMAAMYSALGLAAAASGKVFGQVLSNPVFVGVVAVIFGAFGLSLIGLFEIQLPTKWQTALSGAGKAGPAGAFGMGLVAGIIAAPCTGPVLGAVLAYVAATRNLVLGFWLLFTFAIGMGLLFLALGTFAGLANRLPKSGPWMDRVKALLGIVMFAMALYFLKEVVPGLADMLSRTPQTFLWAAVLLAGGVVLGALRGSGHGAQATAVARKLAAVAACAVGAYMVIGSLLLPPAPAEAVELTWRADLDQALADARRAGKPVMIDFYADWCVLCKELDAYTFSHPAVAVELEDFVLVRKDLTELTEENAAISRRFGIVGLPHVTFIDGRGNVRDELTLTGFEKPEEFLAHRLIPMVGEPVELAAAGE